MKIVDVTIETLEHNQLEYTYEQIIDTLWLYAAINAKSTTSESMVKPDTPKEYQQNQDNEKENIYQEKTLQKEQEQIEHSSNKINLHLQSQDSIKHTQNPKVPKGDFFRTPTHKQFDKFHKFAKAFKILREMSVSANEYIFDEEATIQEIANTNIWNITQKLKKELKYSLHIIIEQSKSMEIYEEIIADFLKALKRFTIFKDIDIYYIKEQEYFKLSKDKKFSKFIKIASLKSLQKRNFTFILTDCVSPAWGCSIGYRFLKELESIVPFMIINLLPQRVWRRTQLYKSKEFKITHTKGYLNRNLVSSEIIPENIKEYIKVPITTLEYIPLKNWSRVVAREKNNWLYGAIFEAELYNREANANARQSSVTAQQLLDNFEVYLSPLAKKLAIYLSCVPLTMDIIKIVQKENLKEANYTHVAEVFLSGLLRKSRYKTKSGDRIYEYKEGIQESLFKRLALYKKIEILRHNSSFISNNLGSNINFQALLENPHLESGVELTESDIIFAQILVELFEEMGGEYANLANELEESLERNRGELDSGKEDTEVIIPTSKRFMMGSNDGYNDEKPVHEVVINYDFEIAKYPVTFEEYDLFCEDTDREKPDDEGWGRGKRPVINVSWNDAKAYCKWLSEKIGEEYRLPTEAEWEYACRAGTTTKWSFGDDEKELEKYVWYDKNSDGKTHPVGEKEPNPWGLYDMHGNVWEWCEDDWVDNYKNTPTDGKPYISEKLDRKVRRGGSCINSAYVSRSSDRGDWSAGFRSGSIGFRLLRTLPSDEKIASIVVDNTLYDKKSKDIEDLIYQIENKIEELETFYENLTPYSQLEYTYSKEEFSNEKDVLDNHYLISEEFDSRYLDEIIDEIKDDIAQLQGILEQKDFSDKELIFSLLKKQYKTTYDKIEESYGIDKDCKVYVENRDTDYNKKLLFVLAEPKEESDELDYEEFIDFYAEDLIKLMKDEVPINIIGKEVSDKGLPENTTQKFTITSVLSFEDTYIKYAGVDKSSNFMGNKISTYWATVEFELKVEFAIHIQKLEYYENEEFKLYYKLNKILSNGLIELKGQGIISTTVNINGIIENDILDSIEEIEIEEISLIEELINEEQAIENIKKWFFEHYEDPANSLPYESKEGGYQWIHGEPVDTEEAVSNNFGDKYSEDIIEKAIDEIGRHELWSPIPQSEKEFQDALGDWAKRKADEDES